MNLVEPGLAFLEGLALIASPCILPVLPLILSASVEGGKRRPFGIIIGFVLAFSLFALGSRKLVNSFGVDLDIIKNISLVLLALFGLVLLSSKLSEKFSSMTQGAANLGNKLSFGGKDGLLSGVTIGALIGLVWTPCAGPILAAVLVQVIRQENDSASLFIILPFAIGVGIPMLIISLLGRKAVSRLGFLSAHAETIRKVFGAIIMLAVLFIASGIDVNNLFSAKETQAVSTNSLKDGLRRPYQAPEFAEIESWLNSEPLTMQSLRGKVVLIDFWTYSCINCIRTLPYITEWDEKYRDKGLVIVGVHAPEFEFEKSKDNVSAALMRYNIHYPVALDNNLDTWTNFKNQYWPAHYLINRKGEIVYTHFGEGNYAKTENNIRYLLGLNKTAPTKQETSNINEGQTPETYLGYDRARRFSSPQDVPADMDESYTIPKKLELHHWALKGKWKITSERIIASEEGATIKLHFKSKKVFLVLGGNKKKVGIKLRLNGKPVGDTLTVDSQKLYELIDQNVVQDGMIEITAQSEGLEAYAFTFGN